MLFINDFFGEPTRVGSPVFMCHSIRDLETFFDIFPNREK